LLHDVNSDLIQRINTFEQWCYRRIWKIKWTDRIPNAEVMQRMKVPEMCLYKASRNRKWHLQDMSYEDPAGKMHSRY